MAVEAILADDGTRCPSAMLYGVVGVVQIVVRKALQYCSSLLTRMPRYVFSNV
jgi:hypothetical protein